MYLILGYGRTGQSVANYLEKLNKSFIVYDESKNFTPVINWDEIKYLIQSPGIAISHPVAQQALQHKVRILTDINILQKCNPNAHYIGITGTNGKSTTTALIGHILKEANIKVAVGGNIGIPVLDLPVDQDWYVLELSSYQLELSENLNLDTAVWLNISPDHLERHGNIENYLHAKKRIFEKSNRAAISIDDDFSNNVAEKLQIPFASVSANKKADVYVNENGMLHCNNQTFDLNKCLNLKGQHNWQNAAVAFAATIPIVKNAELVFKGMQNFPGLVHRQQNLGKIQNVLFINDSKATNANATEKALNTYKDYNIFLILGGKDKPDGIESLRSYFSKIKKAYLIGDAQERFAQSLQGIVDFEKCNILEIAVKKSFQDAKNYENAVVLFSPACASFDQFKDFEHRGEEFQKFVNSLL